MHRAPFPWTVCPLQRYDWSPKTTLMCKSRNVEFMPLSPKIQTFSPPPNALGSFLGKQALDTYWAPTSGGGSGWKPLSGIASPRLVIPPCSGNQLWDSEHQEGLRASLLLWVECMRSRKRRTNALFCFCELLGKRPALADHRGQPSVSCCQSPETVWLELGPLSTEGFASIGTFLGDGLRFSVQVGWDQPASLRRKHWAARPRSQRSQKYSRI